MHTTATTEQGDRGRPRDHELPRSPDTLPAAPRFFAGSHLDYEHGVAHGAWVDASRSDDAIALDIASMLQRSPTALRNGIRARNWAVMGAADFADFDLQRERSLAWIGAVGRGIVMHGPAFAAYAGGVEDVAALDEFANDYLGVWPSLEHYARSFEADAGYNRLLDDNLPDTIRGYVRLDTDAIAHDMAAAGAVHAAQLPDGQFALFAAH